MGDRQREAPEGGGSQEGRKRGQGAPEKDNWLGVQEEREEEQRETRWAAPSSREPSWLRAPIRLPLSAFSPKRYPASPLVPGSGLGLQVPEGGAKTGRASC